MDEEKDEQISVAEHPGQEVEPESPNGVFVSRDIAEDGTISTNLQMVGDVKITELETILKVALRTVTSKLNL